MSLDALKRMFTPNAIAVVGASRDPSRIGGRPIKNLKSSGYAGKIFPINPSQEIIQDLKAYTAISEIPGMIDLAILAIPAEYVFDALEQAATKGAAGAVILSSGFAEIGAEGRKLQTKLVKRAKQLNIRLMGPNTLGFYSAHSRVVASFGSLFEAGNIPQGPTAIVSQSGAFGSHLAIKAVERGIGLRYWVTTGNEADISTIDVVNLLADDPELKVIGIYLEGVTDGRALMSAIARAREAGKRVVVIKVGRTESGSKAAASHTASMAANDTVFDAALAQVGALRVKRTDELLEALYVLSKAKDLSGDRLGILTVSGGAGVLMADAAHEAGLSIPVMPQDAQDALRKICPFGSPVNPLDVTAQCMNEPHLVTQHLQAMFAEGNFDAAVGFFMNWFESPILAERMKSALRAGLEGFEDRTFALVANMTPETRAEFEAEGILVFDDPTGTMEALAQLRHQSLPARKRNWDLGDASHLGILARMDEYDTLQVMSHAGVCLPDIRKAKTPEEAGRFAEEFGMPVAIKILSPDILHKTDVGGVELNVHGKDAAIRAAEAIYKSVGDSMPKAEITGYLVAPMVRSVAECIVGAKLDPTFGPVILVGLGGIYAEVFGDISLRVAPVTLDDARDMLVALKSWPLLDGARKSKKADVNALAALIVSVSDFIVANRMEVSAVELNPVAVGPIGQGAFALDALIERIDAA